MSYAYGERADGRGYACDGGLIMTVSVLVAFIGELSVLLGVVIAFVGWMHKLSNGTRCQLRSEMLRTYYHHKESQKIRQYEYENFVYLYEAYKALKGNSFIDKIYDEVKTWEVES